MTEAEKSARKRIQDFIGVTLSPTFLPVDDGMPDFHAAPCPYTDNGEAQMAAALEATGRFVKGSVTVKCLDDETAAVSGSLKGKIHKTALNVEI